MTCRARMSLDRAVVGAAGMREWSPGPVILTHRERTIEGRESSSDLSGSRPIHDPDGEPALSGAKPPTETTPALSRDPRTAHRGGRCPEAARRRWSTVGMSRFSLALAVGMVVVVPACTESARDDRSPRRTGWGLSWGIIQDSDPRGERGGERACWVHGAISIRAGPVRR